MKRDMDLVVKLLEYFEARDATSSVRVEDIEIPGYDMHVIHYHIVRMYEAGLLEAEASFSKSTGDRRITFIVPRGLTWNGHEFLDAIRDQNIRQKVRTYFGKLPFVILKELAITLARQQLNLPT